MASGARIWSSFRKSSALMGKRSVAASMARLAAPRSSSVVVRVMRLSGGFGLRSGELLLVDLAGEVFADGGETLIERFGGHVGEQDVIARAGEDVGDAVAHGACADDCDPRLHLVLFPQGSCMSRTVMLSPPPASLASSTRVWQRDSRLGRAPGAFETARKKICAMSVSVSSRVSPSEASR